MTAPTSDLWPFSRMALGFGWRIASIGRPGANLVIARRKRLVWLEIRPATSRDQAEPSWFEELRTICREFRTTTMNEMYVLRTSEIARFEEIIGGKSDTRPG